MKINLVRFYMPLFLLISWSCNSQTVSLVYESPSLQIKKISEHAYIHITFLETKQYGKVACNGMIMISDSEAIILETPIDDDVSLEMINWIEKEQNADIIAVIAHHFHIDCLGGLKAFHDLNIPSYGNEQTMLLAKKVGNISPKTKIVNSRKFQIGNNQLISTYLGAAHTADNIVSYFPREEILFGGCMIKTLNAGKGNLEDANQEQWPATVRKIQKKYPNLKWVVPGHGREGGAELLTYTIDLFEE